MNTEILHIFSFPELLQKFTTADIHRFDCGDADLNDFFKYDAGTYHEQKLASTHVVCSDTDIVAFFTLTADCLHKQRIASSDAIDNYQHLKYPALKIARIAVNLPYQNTGVGTWCMKKIFTALSRISEIAAFRFITVDAKVTNDVYKYYERFGFRQVPLKKTEDTIPMYIDYFALYSYVSNIEKDVPEPPK